MKRLFALLIAALVAVPVLAACTGSDAVSTSPDRGASFVYGHSTVPGQLYPMQDRKQAGKFSGALLDGRTFHSSSTAGKITVVNFWATWCAPCKVETPQFDSVYRQVKSKGVDFVGIDTNDQPSPARAFVKNNDISYPIVSDEEGEITIKLGHLPGTGLPFTVLLDKRGRVAAVYTIRLSPVDLTHSIDKLLAGK